MRSGNDHQHNQAEQDQPPRRTPPVAGLPVSTAIGADTRRIGFDGYGVRAAAITVVNHPVRDPAIADQHHTGILSAARGGERLPHRGRFILDRHRGHRLPGAGGL